MGGSGSGFNGCRKLTTAEVLKLDIQYMNIKRAVNYSGSVEWKRGGSIGIKKPNEHELILSYTNTLNGATKNYNYSVGLEYTPCQYGGERVWFVCPHCMKRTRILYQRGGLFKCRSCQRLNYSIQQEDKRDYTMESFDRKIFKIQDRLKTERDINNTYGIPKPKGMHYKTYYNLMEQLQRLYIQRDNVFFTIMRSFKAFKDYAV